MGKVIGVTRQVPTQLSGIRSFSVEVLKVRSQIVTILTVGTLCLFLRLRICVMYGH